MLFTFENLPDEILMIIFQYSGNVLNVLRTFLGLNQRLNNILLDKRLHLLTDFLFINVRNDYYNSEIFHQVSQQLLRINTIVDEEKLCQILQPLLSFHIKQKYIEIGQKLQSSLVTFTLIRQQFTSDELRKVDDELRIQFGNLRDTSKIMETIKHIKSLVLTKGARLKCDYSQVIGHNPAIVINEKFLFHIDNRVGRSSISMNSLLQLFKTLIISDLTLLDHLDYYGHREYIVDGLLIRTLYQFEGDRRTRISASVNMECYRATIDLFLFVLQCRKQMPGGDLYIQQYIYDILGMVLEISNDFFIGTFQLEILKIVIDECVIKQNVPLDDCLQRKFKRILRQLVKTRRIYMIKYTWDHLKFQELFNEPNHFREYVDVMTSNQLDRRYFSIIMDDAFLNSFLPKERLIFILLDKKERKLLEKLLKLSPCLIDELDEDGNDPLLYICLKVHGCRHRIIEFLIKMGSDLKRRNFNGQNFMEILQLQRNRKLLKSLIEYEII
jgi:hypothetical protein